MPHVGVPEQNSCKLSQLLLSSPDGFNVVRAKLDFLSVSRGLRSNGDEPKQILGLGSGDHLVRHFEVKGVDGVSAGDFSIVTPHQGYVAIHGLELVHLASKLIDHLKESTFMEVEQNEVYPELPVSLSLHTSWS